MNADREATLAGLVAAALDQQADGRTPDLAELCRAHPDLLPEVRAALGLGQALPALHRASVDGDPWAGRVLAGRYHLRRRLGAGAAGSVYDAHDRELDRAVAVKVLHHGLLAGATAEERFLREATVLAQNEHPAVVRVYDRGRTADGTLFLVTELLHGIGLHEVLQAARQAMPQGAGADAFASIDWLRELLPEATLERSLLRQCVAWAAQLGDGLSALHRKGILHRDVKPSNAFVRRDGQAVLLDFGIAVRAGDPSLTLQTSIVGTPWYMAPEQATAGTAPSPTIDVYGLTATLYHLLTLRPPHEGALPDVLRAVREQEPAPAARLHRGLPRDLQAILDRGLAPLPRQRYPDAAALTADLSAFLDHRPVQARPLGWPGRLARQIRRRPARSAAAFTGIAAVLLLAVAVPLAATVQAHARTAERGDLLARLPGDLCIEGWPDQRLLVPMTERGAAIAQLDRLLELDPDDLPTRLLRASERLDAGEVALARADLALLAGRSPYLAAVARCYAAADGSRAGIDAVLLAELPEPREPGDFFVAGFHALRQRDVRAAADLLGRVPDYLPARDLRLLALLGLGRWDEARDEARELEGRYGRPTARTRHALGAAMLATRHYEEALELCRHALALRPDRHGPWNNLGYANLRLGRFAEARECLERAVAIRPWFDNSRAGLCQALRGLEQFAAAREQAQAVGAPWWQRWELACVDLAESLAAARAADPARAAQLARAAAAGYRAVQDDGGEDNLKRGAAGAAVAYAEALARADRAEALAPFLLELRRDLRSPTHLLNLADLLENQTPSPQAIDLLRLYFLELAQDLAPDDPRLPPARAAVLDQIRQKER